VCRPLEEDGALVYALGRVRADSRPQVREDGRTKVLPYMVFPYIMDIDVEQESGHGCHDI